MTETGGPAAADDAGGVPEVSGGGMSGLDPDLGIAEDYRRFARREAAGRSPAYESLARSVPDDDALLGFLAGLPAQKQQPNLLFAAARYLLGAVPGAADLHRLVVEEPDRLAEALRARRTQTNEPARCATILPALRRLPQPLALIEVGASAGLTLLVDRYSYDYDGSVVTGTDPLAPTLSCHVEGPVPLPGQVPEVIWRQGIDLNPLDPASDEDVRWLECLIWPGEEGRVPRLHDAAAVARRHPVTVRRGDLLDDLAAVVAEAPSDATAVVFHTAVLAYVEADKRAAFADAWCQAPEGTVVCLDPGVTGTAGRQPGAHQRQRSDRDTMGCRADHVGAVRSLDPPAVEVAAAGFVAE